MGEKARKQQDQQQTAQKKKDAEALDKAYQAGLDRIPDAAKKQDPWQKSVIQVARSRSSSARSRDEEQPGKVTIRKCTVQCVGRLK